MHLYDWPKYLLDMFNELGKSKKVTFLIMSYDLKDYDNINVNVIDFSEHVIAHEFNYLLSLELHERRKPTHDFLFASVLKDNFRTTIHSYLKNGSFLDNSILLTGQGVKSAYDYRDQFIETLSKIPENHTFLPALQSWGSGFPNMSVYEKIFCEIVLESRNIGKSDISEKTYRPFSLNIPILFLGTKEMYQKLINDGYLFADKDNFYDSWHQERPLDQKLDKLGSFIMSIKNDTGLRQELVKVAKHNYENFWARRKLSYLSTNYKNLKKCFNKSFAEIIYNNLNY